jgi:hypothetical protein
MAPRAPFRQARGRFRSRPGTPLRRTYILEGRQPQCDGHRLRHRGRTVYSGGIFGSGHSPANFHIGSVGWATETGTAIAAHLQRNRQLIGDSGISGNSLNGQIGNLNLRQRHKHRQHAANNTANASYTGNVIVAHRRHRRPPRFHARRGE